MTSLSEHDWGTDPIFDSAVTRHGFRFTHCVEAVVRTQVPPEVWRRSWSDEFIDYAAWKNAGEPGGFVWGVEWAEAYPGVEYVARAESAVRWSGQLAKPMHALKLATNAYVIELVCHDLVVTRLAVGDPVTGELKPVE